MQQDARTGFAQGNGRAGVDRVNRLEGLDRRALIQRALLLVGGAALSLPQVAWAQEGAPYLAPERLDLIAAYADSVIPATDTPGAIDAGVPRAIDAMLRESIGRAHV